MLANHMLLRFASSIFIYSLISGIPSLLHAAAEESYTIQVGSLNCKGLACCAITECPDLPSCKGERNGDYWIHCKREGCLEYAPDRIGQVMTVCDYNCTKTSLPFLYDFQKKVELFAPELITLGCVVIGGACAVVSATCQRKEISLKRIFAYSCVGGLLGLNCILANKSDFLESALLAYGGTVAISVTSEYMLK